MPGRLYKAGALEPIADIGDRVVLLDQTGPINEGTGPDITWFECVFVEPIFGLGQKGLVLLWTQAGAAPAGYSLPSSGAASGSITSGANVTATPSAFNMNTHQLLQFRWNLRVINTGIVIDDVDLQVALPQASPRFAAFTQQSFWNARWQLNEASDTAYGPAQGAEQANPTSPVGISTPDWTNLNELYVYEQTYVPTWTIWNRSSGTWSTSGMAIGVDVWGFRYDVQPIKQPDADWKARWLLGRQRVCPPDFRVIPITGRQAGSQVAT